MCCSKKKKKEEKEEEEEEEEEKSLKPTDGLTKVNWKEELLPREEKEKEYVSLIPHARTPMK